MSCRSSSTRVCRVSSQRMTSAERSSSRRRSVTSSRFPIGVAQTASGTALTDCVERHEAGADQPGRGPELCTHDRDAVARLRERLTAQDLARGVEHEVTRGREAAADHDQLRVEDVHEAPDAGAKAPADAVEKLDRTPLSSIRAPHEPVRVDRGPELRRRELSRRDPGDVCLQMPASRARPLTRQSVVLDHDVPELGPAAVELPVDDRAASAARAEGEHDHRVDVARCAETEFSVGGSVRIIFDSDREAEALLHPAAKVHVLQRDVHGLKGPARPLVDWRRETEPKRNDLVGQELLDGYVQPRQQLVLGGGWGRMLAALLHVPVPVDDPREDLRAAEVEADDAFFVQTARLPYWLAKETGSRRHPSPCSEASTSSGQRQN